MVGGKTFETGAGFRGRKAKPWRVQPQTTIVMLKVIEIAFCCYAVIDMAMIFDPDGNTICIHKRNAK
jgi:hypothetical protein